MHILDLTEVVTSSLTKESIKDRSKADGFTKAFACVQSSWLIIQSIARVANGLAITQLELTTLGFVICALAMYVLWWHKPFDVDYVAYIGSPGTLMPPRIRDSLPQYEGRIPDLSLHDLQDMLIEYEFVPILWGRGYYLKNEGFRHRLKIIILYITATIFPALHVLAWN